MLRLTIVFCIILSTAFGKTDDSSLIDFNSIKGVIKNDMLSKEVDKKTKKISAKKTIRKRNKISKYDIPTEREFWTFASEYWLVKNATVLKWDFEKPDYGINNAFSDFLKRMGVFEKNFKILFLNTPEVAHMALPGTSSELIFLVSVPFMRVLDLSKLEICLLLFEDYLRLEKNYFKDHVMTAKLRGELGKNFSGKKLNRDLFLGAFAKYNEIIFKSGFSFQQQFAVTKYYGSILKSDLKLWNAYLALLKKIDNLVKSNVLYNEYVKIYPSPELQISWLVPSKKVLD